MTPAFQVLFVAIAFTLHVCHSEVLSGGTDAFENADKKLEAEVESFRQILGALSRQVMLQQLFVEERIRSDGASGVKQVRIRKDGTRNYYSDTHGNADRLLAIHEHANNIRTVGLGEFIGVLNGVEFRTRHNDYRLFMASTTSKDYHATEEIPFPDVPPEVTNKATVDEQIVEMREWFKAWKSQNDTVRDYRKYFKPVLCYLEGAWGTASKDIDEPFESDRHFIDANSWFDLQEKVRFTSYTGRKDNLENFSFLPTTIMEIINGTIPVFAQWNYRISCHPLSRDIPLNRFRVVDEFHVRLPSGRIYEEETSTRAARFQLNPEDSDKWTEAGFKGEFTLLDELMSEIPGKDNYQGDLTDEAFELPVHTIDPKKSGKLNAAYYHRWFKVLEEDAMGQSTRHRGYADENLFMAMTTQPKVAGMKLTTCKGPKSAPSCNTISQKFSYAIPLEIIYLTPLNSWNPFDLEYKGDESLANGKTVYEGGRNGGNTPDKAYNGINSKKYYQTPSAFFSGLEVSSEAADTTENNVGVLNKTGAVRITRASGIRVFFPEIKEVGVLRQRYPIMPVHGEGSPVWKELEATKDILMKSKTYGYIYKEPLGGSGASVLFPKLPERPITLKMEYATLTPPGPHIHEITLTPDEVKLAKGKKQSLVKRTTAGDAHQHVITVYWSLKNEYWAIRSCDDQDTRRYRCWDQHGKNLIEDINV
ncbi:hypothetical protein OS493_024731 [Desmophyllum pertusum]|uniref:Uncharacterized protein n=1 Tax=Desmophyllum pertusum TaxID=174260 RepID=A0A9W9ZDB5_9CNID|nr:hypothetical protein OS493_024731 [Desmophyllum pertusum]